MSQHFLSVLLIALGPTGDPCVIEGAPHEWPQMLLAEIHAPAVIGWETCGLDEEISEGFQRRIRRSVRGGIEAGFGGFGPFKTEMYSAFRNSLLLVRSGRPEPAAAVLHRLVEDLSILALEGPSRLDRTWALYGLEFAVPALRQLESRLR